MAQSGPCSWSPLPPRSVPKPDRYASRGIRLRSRSPTRNEADRHPACTNVRIGHGMVVYGLCEKNDWNHNMRKPEPISDAEFLKLMKLFDEDVRSLIELTYPNGPVQYRHVRQASVIVRRWLCDNELRRITDQIQVPVTFPMLKDTSIFEKIRDDPDIDYYLSAGVKFDGKPIWALYHSHADEPPNWVHELSSQRIELVKLSKLMKRPVLHFNGEDFSMERTLRFACNKLGGAHFDPSRDEQEEKLDLAARYVTFGPPENSLEPGEAGEIHLPLEPKGSEVLSGIAVVIIVAASMMVNIHFDGQPLFELKQGSAST